MKIYLKTHSNKKALKEIWSEVECLGVIPAKLLPFSLKLSESDDLTEVELKNLIEECYNFAQSKLLDYLAMSEKTSYDCSDFLKRYHIPEKQIMDLLAYVKSKAYLSDDRFAELYIQEAMLYNKSPEEIRYKLKLKRLSSDLINRKLAEFYGLEQEKEILNDLIDRLLISYDIEDDRKLFDKCSTTLYRKGFKYCDFNLILQKKINNKT